VARTGDDTLIGGTTSYDSNTASNLAALAAIMAEWGSADWYATRVSDLLNCGGQNVVNACPSAEFIDGRDRQQAQQPDRQYHGLRLVLCWCGG
jgi:hypothetical protein